jgi:hypothetical protein
MLEEHIIEAIKAELHRQAADKPSDLSIETDDGFRIRGLIDLDALAMAVAGSVAGGLEVETNPIKLRELADRARRLADGAEDQETKSRLIAASAEYEQRAKEIEMDDITGQ